MLNWLLNGGEHYYERPTWPYRFFYWLRLGIKKIALRWGGLIEYCHDCGLRQPLVWWADNELWSELMDEKLSNDMAGVVCPKCFDRRAWNKGIMLRWIP